MSLQTISSIVPAEERKITTWPAKYIRGYNVSVCKSKQIL